MNYYKTIRVGFFIIILIFFSSCKTVIEPVEEAGLSIEDLTFANRNMDEYIFYEDFCVVNQKQTHTSYISKYRLINDTLTIDQHEIYVKNNKEFTSIFKRESDTLRIINSSISKEFTSLFQRHDSFYYASFARVLSLSANILLSPPFSVFISRDSTFVFVNNEISVVKSSHYLDLSDLDSAMFSNTYVPYGGPRNLPDIEIFKRGENGIQNLSVEKRRFSEKRVITEFDNNAQLQAFDLSWYEDDILEFSVKDWMANENATYLVLANRRDLHLTDKILRGNLKDLSIGGSKVNSISSKIIECDSLVSIDATNCKFRVFPEEFFNSNHKLKSLGLSNCDFNKYDYEFKNLHSLWELHLAGNNLRSIPFDLENAKNLIFLDLSNNPLTEIPEDIIYLSSLSYLDISGINFTEISEVLLKMVNLRRLVIDKKFENHEVIQTLSKRISVSCVGE